MSISDSMDDRQLEEDSDEESSPPTLDATSSPEKKKSGRSCKSNCINCWLVGIKATLFIFYGGIGVLVTWLNESQFSKQFSEREIFLIYGLSALCSIAMPIIFGLISDKTAQPKKVLVFCLILTGLLYPLIRTTTQVKPYNYKDKLEKCASEKNTSFCRQERINCTTSYSELIIPNFGGVGAGCGEGCKAESSISNCQFVGCGNLINDDDAYSQYEDYDIPQQDEPALIDSTNYAHLCIANDPKKKPICYVFDRFEVQFSASGLSGYEDKTDGKCHYPLIENGSPQKSMENLNESEEEMEKENHPRQLLYCSPHKTFINPQSQKSQCSVQCDVKISSWFCSSDYSEWNISFAVHVCIHVLGVMMMISSAALLNAAILSLSHEHRGQIGCQFTYAILGFGLITPGFAWLFENVLTGDVVPWNLDYIGLYAIFPLLAALFALTTSYHAEWKPKPHTVRPMLYRWCLRRNTMIFFALVITLGVLQGLLDVFSYHQIKLTGANLLQLGIGASASIAPALIFMFRVNKVVDYTGYQNIFGVALVVFSLQFTGYVYLWDAIPEWSYLLKAMDTFSIFLVVATSAFTCYNSAPRSLVATCQGIVLSLYCCLGRGVGCILGWAGLSIFTKEIFMKIISIFCLAICVLYLLIHYCCLKPSSFKHDFDRPGSAFAPSGKYTQLKLINGKPENEEKGELATTEEDHQDDNDNLEKIE